MKYRQISKIIMHNILRDRIIEPDDGLTYGEHKPFTPKQVIKVQAALDADRERLRKRLKTQGVKLPSVKRGV